MNKKTLIRIIISAVAVLVLGVCIYFVSTGFASKGDGTITVVYADLEGQTIKKEDIVFEEGDKLVDLIGKKFDNFVVTDGMVMSIEDFNTPSDWSQYLCIYVDGEMSMVGILDIVFTDGTVITLQITEYIPY